LLIAASKVVINTATGVAFGVEAGLTIMSNDFIYGMRHGWSNPVPFGINLEDQRQHVYTIGKTGSGKSTLLRNILIQAIDAGLGVGLIDPHGQLAEEILDHIPSHRADHLTYFNPGDTEFPIGLNVLANVKPEDRHLAASGIVQACKGIWHESWGPRMEYILHNSIVALMHCQNATLLGVNRLLSNKAYRDWVVRQIDDPFNRSFWLDEFEAYEPRFQREVIAPIQNKLGQFISSPVIRNMIGQVKTRLSIPFKSTIRAFSSQTCAKEKLVMTKHICSVPCWSASSFWLQQPGMIKPNLNEKISSA
jgi:hypothetical protein